MTKAIINQKAKKFKLFLVKNNLEFFHVDEKGDKLRTVIFRTTINTQGKRLPLFYFTDNTIYTLIKVHLLSNTATEKKLVELMHYINELNTTYKIFKYSIDHEKNIILEISLPYDNKFFDARIVMALIILATDNVKETYPEFTRLVCEQT